MPPPELVTMFAVPFAFSRFVAYEKINAELTRYILEQEARGSVAANSRPLTHRNASVFESHFDLFREMEPSIQELKTFCWDQLLAVIGRLNDYDLLTLERLQIFNDCWFHVTRRGGFFGLHNHPNASWSAVYCVDPGNHDADKNDSGTLSFVNPMIMSAMHMDAGVARMQLPYGNQVANLHLSAGQLVIFPSWVLHEVKPFEGEGQRITIAFNCWFNLPEIAR